MGQSSGFLGTQPKAQQGRFHIVLVAALCAVALFFLKPPPVLCATALSIMLASFPSFSRQMMLCAA
jgi:hypothetical protein